MAKVLDPKTSEACRIQHTSYANPANPERNSAVMATSLSIPGYPVFAKLVGCDSSRDASRAAYCSEVESTSGVADYCHRAILSIDNGMTAG
jgi:hypothetical protein